MGYGTKKAYSTANCLSLRKVEEQQIAENAPILLTPSINYVQYEQGCAVQVRMCFTNQAHLQYEQGCAVQSSKSSSFGTVGHY